MAELIQWANATSKPSQDDGISPRTITPKNSFQRHSPQRSPSARASPSRISPSRASPTRRETFNEDYERKGSPLRAEFKAGGPLAPEIPADPQSPSHTTSDGLRFESPTPGAYQAAANGFRLQEAPKGKRSTSDYFGKLQRTPNTIPEKEAETETPTNGLARRLTNVSDADSPQGRRSVQFARLADFDGSNDGQTRQNEVEAEETEESKSRQSSLFARLKAFATPLAGPQQGHSRYASSAASTYGTPFLTPASELAEPQFPNPHHDGSEAEGDIEESEGEAVGPMPLTSKRKHRRWLDPAGSSTAPTTPKTPRFPSFLRDSSTTPDGNSESRPNFFTRRATMGEIPENSRAGVSEDEGRDRFAKRWRRGIDGARGLSYSQGTRRPNPVEAGDDDRPTALRRFTGIAGFDGAGSPFRTRNDRHNSTSAVRWRQVKAGLKMLGQKKKDERVKVDYQKSAELMAELLAGSPAALFLASMYQRDEHGRQKIPVLLEQLKVSITSGQLREDKAGDRHTIFTINLEYGNGPARMQWTIHRSLRDFYNLHLKYKIQGQTDRLQLRGEDKHRAKLPRFPRGAVPYLRGLRGLGDDDFEDEELPGEISAAEGGDASGTDRPTMKKRRQTSLARKVSFHSKRPSTGAPGTPGTPGGTGGANVVQSGGEASTVGPNGQKNDPYPDRQRKKLEMYLQRMIRWLIFRPDSTRLCKFLEVSALAMRLSVEGGYHGKEGLLRITSSRSVERHGLAAIRALPDRFQHVYEKAHHKWFLVRHSYIVAVDSPESLLPVEVFLVDSDFATVNLRKRGQNQSGKEKAKSATANASGANILKLYNSERKLRLMAKNERQLGQFRESVEHMQRNTIWSQKHRFDSFAPVRKNVFARWLVDGRDHMWQVSRAIKHARNFIYIHDWWLSPELYLRRPAAISQDWRLDRLLKEKAEQGVKIFVIVYRNIESAIPIDSDHTKSHLLDLHPNICVQRSPNQFRQNQFFWAHHEKLVVVDNAMAFVGGVDLCYGRWDDPSHSVTDDKLTGFEIDGWVGPRNSDTCQMWPGKDYSNPRVQDFYALDRVYEEMYDRTKVPRMPWHDIAMCIVGQPARDVARHFVQRWNYILRQRTPSRPTPVLLPPPEFEKEELDKLGMHGTCQIQILRSCSSWSIGTPNKTEHSIMTAYESLIKGSEHFVYIENQFFITSCEVEGTIIHNKIGDALVERIERAAENGEKWRACIIIPLMPGFQNSVDAQDGTSIRLIMQCQYRSICRGEKSIFNRLRAKGIEPQDYIEFYALRQWGKIGPTKSLTTEQLYIHAKCMIVDDRAVIIGSANINERSMLGSRDSEVAAVVTDQESMPSFMGGEPYEVGVFPHTLRMRLMREHLGIDVDEFYNNDRDDASDELSMADELKTHQRDESPTAPGSPTALTEQNLAAGQHNQNLPVPPVEITRDWVDRTENEVQRQTSLPGTLDKAKTSRERLDLDIAGFGPDNAKRLADAGFTHGRESFVNTQGHEVLSAPLEAREPRRKSSTVRYTSHSHGSPGASPTPPWNFARMNTEQLGLTQLSQLPALPIVDDTDIGGPPVTKAMSENSAGVVNPLLQSMRRPVVNDDCMQDPLADAFYQGIWHKVAENNTKLYRQVFRCMPDSDVQSWKQYREFNAYNEKFMQSQGLGQSKPKQPREAPDSSGPPGSAGTESMVNNKLAQGAVKTHNRLSDFTSRLLRPTSNASDTSKNPEMAEKSRLEAGSRASDAPTATATQVDGEVDEKAALRQGEDLVSTAPTEHEKAAAATSPDPERAPGSPDPEKTGGTARRSRTITFSQETGNEPNHAPETTATQSHAAHIDGPGLQHSASQKRRKRATTRSSAHITPEVVLEKDEAESLLNLVQGHLVLWPYDWLEKEERSGNWLYNIDQIAPLEIYD